MSKTVFVVNHGLGAIDQAAFTESTGRTAGGLFNYLGVTEPGVTHGDSLRLVECGAFVSISNEGANQGLVGIPHPYLKGDEQFTSATLVVHTANELPSDINGVFIFDGPEFKDLIMNDMFFSCCQNRRIPPALLKESTTLAERVLLGVLVMVWGVEGMEFVATTSTEDDQYLVLFNTVAYDVIYADIRKTKIEQQRELFKLV